MKIFHNSITLHLCLIAALFQYFCRPLSINTLSKLPPHSGYHGGSADSERPFFEGWYMRLVTKDQDSLALIFHVFDPNLEDSPRKGVGIQVITPAGSASVESKDVSSFRGDPHRLSIRNIFSDSSDYFRLTSQWASGRVTPIASLSNTVSSVIFGLEISPEIGWGGDRDSRQFSTAGWLAAFPIFEPHYQVLVSRGRAIGSLCVNLENGETQSYNLDDATVYIEKNWGGSFPSRWWWIQANTFKSHNLCVTSTAGRRRIPLLGEEEVGLVGLHWNGLFLIFSSINWSVQWGSWKITGEYEEYSVVLVGSCKDKGFPVDCPASAGMQSIARETFHGTLHVKLTKNGDLVLDDYTDEACLEIGGLPWDCRNWEGRSQMKEPIKTVAMNVELEKRISDALAIASNVIEIPGL